MAFALLPTSAIFFLLLVLSCRVFRRLRFKLPPGPRPWPVVGNLYDVKPLRCRCFAEWAQTYGPIISVWFGSNLNVIVSDSELAKQVLKDHDQHLADRARSRPIEEFSKDGTDLIWADYGPHYVKLRKVCTLELFCPKRLEDLRPVREDEVTAMIESIFHDSANPENHGRSLLMRKYLGAVSFNNITRLVFGKRFVNGEGVMDEQGREFKEIIAEGFKLAQSLSIAEHIPWLSWMFPLEKEALAKQKARRNQLSKAIMTEYILAKKKTGSTRQHFVDALLTCQDKFDLSMDMVIGLLWDMIVAGMDTSAIIAEWGMAELIKNPEVQKKAQEELDRVIGSERVMTEADISSLPYLQCVAKEALRLHPSTPLMLPHRANANVKVGGYDIPKGTTVHVNAWAIARDPSVWKDPLEFRPERFLEEDVNMKGSDFRLLPFGAGRRVCLGTKLGINLVTSMLGHLLHQFSWSLPHGMKAEEIDMLETPGMAAFMRTPLQAVPTPRLPSHLYKRVVADM